MNRDPRLAYRRPIFNRDLAITMTSGRSLSRNIPQIDTPPSLHAAVPAIPDGANGNGSSLAMPPNATTNYLSSGSAQPTEENTGNRLETRPRNTDSAQITDVQKAMCSAALNAMGGSHNIDEKMRKFIDAAMELQSAIPDGANLHCFMTCPVSTNAASENEVSLFPLVSRLFHSALHASRRGSTVLGQALRDTFLIAHRVAHGRIYGGQRPTPIMPRAERFRYSSCPRRFRYSSYCSGPRRFRCS